MTPQETILVALAYCPELKTKSLEEFLDSLLDEDLDVLAQMPGTPGQVMAAQFTHYVRSSTTLAETHRRDTTQAERLMDALLRLPKRRVRAGPARRATDGPAPSRTEAAA